MSHFPTPTPDEVKQVASDMRDSGGAFFDFAATTLENLPRSESLRDLGLDESFIAFLRNMVISILASESPQDIQAHLVTLFILGNAWGQRDTDTTKD